MKAITSKNSIDKNPEFISLVMTGNNIAVEKFYCVLIPFIKSVIRKLGFVFRVNDIDSLTHDIFVKTYNQLPKYCPERNLFSWVYSLTKNHLIDLKRQENKLTISVDETPELNHLAGACLNPEEIQLKKEEINHLISLLNLLKPEDKKLIEDFYFAGLSLRELQVKYGLPSQNSVSIRLHRAKKYLKKQKVQLLA